MSATARVLSVNISPGGIPKLPVASATLDTAGLAGDGHDHAKHVTPLQAISLLDAEDLQDLGREGYDVGPGALGENLTVQGLQVDALRPGDRLVLEGGVVLEYTKARKPCFVLDSISPSLKTAVVGRCGGYARVIRGGQVSAGQAIELRHPSPSPDPPWAHTGAVLAGGRSARMGRLKHELAWEGGTLIDAVCAALGQVCRTVVAVGAEVGTGRVIGDLRPGLGPLGGIEALLASGVDSQYLICPCDMPLVSGSLLQRLLGPATALSTVFHVDGEPRFRPLPVRLSAEALGAATAQLDRGERAVHKFLFMLQPAEVRLTPADAHPLAALNTPEEYQAALRRAPGGTPAAAAR